MSSLFFEMRKMQMTNKNCDFTTNKQIQNKLDSTYRSMQNTTFTVSEFARFVIIMRAAAL